MLNFLRPWLVAAGSSAVAYWMAKRGKTSQDRLREVKLELIEQQRTINRLRAELGKEKALRQEAQSDLVEHVESKIRVVEKRTGESNLDK